MTAVDIPAAPRRGIFEGLGRDTLYVLAGFPLAIFSFVVIITGLSLSASLFITFLGLPIGVGTLIVAKWLGLLERARLVARGTGSIPPPVPSPPRSGGVRGLFGRLGEPQAWLAVLHAIVGFPVAVVTFVVTVTWWAGGLGGLTYWFWSRPIPDSDEDNGLFELLGFHQTYAEEVGNAILGVIFLLTLIPVVRACAVVQSYLARLLLANEQVAALQQRVVTLSASRAAVVEAGTSTLRKLERDLHDGPQQRLVRLSMDLASARRRMADNPGAAEELVAGAEQQVEDTLAEIRALSRGIAPPVLADRGLTAALSALAARCTVEVSLDVRLPDGTRLPDSVENTAYFFVAEALTNVAKHSDATECSVKLTRRRGILRIEVRDNGQGGAHPAKGHGLAGLSDRLSAVDGTMSVDSPPGGPTVLVAEVPCP